MDNTQHLTESYKKYCPAECKFCYQRNFVRLFSHIKQKNGARHMRQICKNLLAAKKIKQHIGYPIEKIGNTAYYIPDCDFFAIGLKNSQIESLIKKRYITYIYTTGFNLDVGFIEYLYKKSPEYFPKVHLSVITLVPTIRAELMNPRIDLTNVKKIASILKNPIFFILYMNKEQFMSDISFLNPLTLKNNGQIYIHKLYYDELSFTVVKDLSVSGTNEFRQMVEYLDKNDKKLKNISRRIFFAPEPEIFAWKWRREIKKLLEICKDKSNEAIFCSKAAFPIIRKHITNANVIPVKSQSGGCINYSHDMPVKGIISLINELLAKKINLNQIYLPSSMFPVQKKFDFNLDNVNLIERLYPEIKINVIQIPPEIIFSTVSLEDCRNFYSSPISLS